MNTRMEVVQGDITKMQTTAIVNAANRSLLGGGGVDGAIHLAAGPDLLNECRLLGGCKTGEAKITKGYRLPATSIIHTVGPVWNGGQQREAELLASCYRESLALAARHHIETIAFPAISCGIYGYPVAEAAQIAITEVANFLETNPAIQKVFFVCFENEVFKTYQETLKNLTAERPA